MIKSLVTPKDISSIQKKFDKMGRLTPDEATLLYEASLIESNIQTACHNLIKNEYQYKKDVRIDFVQVDNGSKSKGQKIKKWGEGTKKGFFDTIIFIKIRSYFPEGHQFRSKQIFVEFKKIKKFCKSSIKPEQQYWHDTYKEWGESAHFCNNTPYFEQAIMKEIEEFLR